MLYAFDKTIKHFFCKLFHLSICVITKCPFYLGKLLICFNDTCIGVIFITLIRIRLIYARISKCKRSCSSYNTFINKLFSSQCSQLVVDTSNMSCYVKIYSFAS